MPSWVEQEIILQIKLRAWVFNENEHGVIYNKNVNVSDMGIFTSVEKKWYQQMSNLFNAFQLVKGSSKL